MDSPWNAVYVRGRFERFVASCLEKQSIEHFMPLYTIDRPSHGLRPISLPLFPQYVFYKGDTASHGVLRHIPGVLAIVRGTAGNDVNTKEIQDLQLILKTEVRVRPWPYIFGKDMVTLENGPLRGVSGVIEKTDQKTLLVISIPLILRSAAVEVNQADVFPLGVEAFPLKSRRTVS